VDASKIMMHKKKVFDIFLDDPFINENNKNWGKNIVDSRASSGFKYKGGHIWLGQGIKVLSILGGLCVHDCPRCVAFLAR
jgi:hypothetical protein